MRRPQIGIPLTLDDRGRWREGRSYQYIDRSYADALERAGARIVLLPIQTDPGRLVDGLDGLLIPGGDDFPPEAGLAGAAVADLDPVPPDQLAFDEALFMAAARRSIPILGICYGMQLMARARQGALDVHLPSQRPHASPHKRPARDRHPITIEPDSQLARIIGSETTRVNSLHQQAVSRVGPGHRVVARSPDGIIEAIEAPSPDSRRWEIGVQWHPEKMAEESSERLFRAFVEACRPDNEGAS